jgi:phosphoribosylamine--glycine ligase
MGDPETQPIMMRLKSDLVTCWKPPWTASWTRSRRNGTGVAPWAWSWPPPAIRTIRARATPSPAWRRAKGEDFHVFHAGTAIQDDQVVTAGGRVLCVTALGDTVKIAQARAYEVAEGIDFAGRQMRRDIGWRAIQRKKK